MTKAFTGILEFAWTYRLYQWLAGSHNYYRLFADRYICYKPGQKILDLGCGPADILRFLPADADYTGIDLNPDYIRKAKRSNPGKTFICGDIAKPDFHIEDESFHTIFMIGVQHHLPDEAIEKMLDFAYRKLKPGGKLLSLDPAYSGQQGRLELWFMKNDRGKYIRKPEEYKSLTGRFFKDNSIDIFHGVMHIPFTFNIVKGEKI